MLADDAAHIASVGPGLAAEAGRVGAQLDGQLVEVERFVAIEIRHRDFGGGDQPEIRVLELEQIRCELRQLAGAVQAGGVDHERRQHFGVAVLAGVHVQHEVDQRALQLRAQAPVDGEARAGDFGGALEIQDAEVRARGPNALWASKSKLRRRAPAADFDVIVGALAGGHGVVRQCWERRPATGGTFRRALWRCSSSAVMRSPISRTFCWRSAASWPALLQLADFLRFGVALRFELFGFGERGAALGVELAERFDVEREAAIGQPLGDRVEILAEEREIVHRAFGAFACV